MDAAASSASRARRRYAGGRPLPLTSRPWRATAYVALRAPLPAVAAFAVAAPVAAGRWPAVLTISLPFLFCSLMAGIAVAPAERRGVTLLGGPPVADPHREPEPGTPLGLLRLRSREAATVRELANALVSVALAPLDIVILLGWGLGSVALLFAPLLISQGPVAVGPWTIESAGMAWVAVPVGLVWLVSGAYVVTGLAHLHAVHVRRLLGPRRQELHVRMTELSHSRLRLIDAFDVERRRIERDLHDGAQQRLVALAMTLDLARIELEGGNGEAARLVEVAHGQATRTLAELRGLIQGIHPPILTDRGLAAALPELAGRCPLPVRVTVDLPHRLPDTIETAAWFVVSEALTNAVKHGGATGIELEAREREGVLRLRVQDDGGGGADAEQGTGLVGLGDRVAAVGGRLTLSSPLGGPTVVAAELPCVAL